MVAGWTRVGWSGRGSRYYITAGGNEREPICRKIRTERAFCSCWRGSPIVQKRTQQSLNIMNSQ
jgi:hypothetical protein